MRTRMLVYKAIVVPTLLYGAAESWALTASQAHQLNVFNTSCLRRILGLTRADHARNEQLYSESEQLPSPLCCAVTVLDGLVM
jgi:hypothetical protein